MPNYQESESEKLMNILCDKMNKSQNNLFSVLLEKCAAQGLDIVDLLEIELRDNQTLTKQEIRQVFSALRQVLILHQKESEDNFNKVD